MADASRNNPNEKISIPEKSSTGQSKKRNAASEGRKDENQIDTLMK